MKTHWFNQFDEPALKKPERTEFILPAFTLPPDTWAGASQLLATWSFENSTYAFSLKLPIEEFGENFVAAVSYIDGDTTIRFKLFDNDLAVLYFPIYNGEKLGENALLEIWSVETDEAPTLEDNEVLISSVFDIAPTCPCTTAIVSETLLTSVPLPEPI